MYLKNFLNSSSLLSMARFDAEADERAALRASLMKNNTVIEKPTNAEGGNETDETNEEENDEEGEEEGDEDEEDEDEEGDTDPNEEDLTDEEKAAKEAEKKAAEKAAAKAQRKQERMQRRIDEATAAAKAARDELAAFKAANPDSKLSEEEVEAKAEAKAAEKLAAKKLEELTQQFNETCEKLQKEATKIDKEFYEKIVDISEQFGPIPSFMIGILDDVDNGGEVLAHIANDDDLAEKLWKLSKDGKNAKLTKEIVTISDKLEADKKAKTKKQISKVPEPIKPVGASRSTSTVITRADTRPENMDNYVAKRRAQMEANAKAKGFR